MFLNSHRFSHILTLRFLCSHFLCLLLQRQFHLYRMLKKATYEDNALRLREHFLKGDIDIMRKRTLIHMTFCKDYVYLRTVSRTRKSPHRFYISRHKLEELEHKSEIIAYDIYSFAVLRRDTNAGTIEIAFTWLGSNGDGVSGYQDTIILPYDKMMECLHESSLKGESVVWKTLSIENFMGQAKIEFKNSKNLHAALKNGTIRRKLIRFLRDQFRWGQSEKIEIYDDYVPYSFFFREIRNGKAGLSGGLILHGQQDMKNAYYSMHT